MCPVLGQFSFKEDREKDGESYPGLNLNPGSTVEWLQDSG
jgi:hypothetical protein